MLERKGSLIYRNVIIYLYLYIYKIEKEIQKGNLANEKVLVKIKDILSLMDDNEKRPHNSKNKEKLMQLIYEVYLKYSVQFLIILLASGAR